MLSSIKPGLLKTLFKVGYFDIVKMFQKERVAILMYHRFSEENEQFKISRKEFDVQLKYLKGKYNFIKLKDYVDCLYNRGNRLPPNPLIITIDDGYKDNYLYAYPVLKKYNVPATIFLTTDFISEKKWLWADMLNYILTNATDEKFNIMLDGVQTDFDISSKSLLHKSQLNLFNHLASIDNHQKNELIDALADRLKVEVPGQVTSKYDSLTWPQIVEMSQNGIDFGSHTCSHPICSRLQEEELLRELSISKEVIEKQLGDDVSLFCYPNGQPNDINKLVVDSVQRTGYRAAVTTTYGFNDCTDNDAFSLKRVSYNGDELCTLARMLTRP
ncbi:MAG: polysaccharide deacetylase family protein [Candidatus Thiodiazotropha sp.]